MADTITATPGDYQLMLDLCPEEFTALENDILQRGIMVPVEVDEDGVILDGHHRVLIAEKHGLKFKTITRRFKTDADKVEHAIKLNLARRQLRPFEWGRAFNRLLEARGIERKRGRRRAGSNCATVAQVAAELKVPLDTVNKRLRAAEAYKALSDADRARVDAGEVTLARARFETRLGESRKPTAETDVEQRKTAKTRKLAANGSGVYLKSKLGPKPLEFHEIADRWTGELQGIADLLESAPDEVIVRFMRDHPFRFEQFAAASARITAKLSCVGLARVTS